MSRGRHADTATTSLPLCARGTGPAWTRRWRAALLCLGLLAAGGMAGAQTGGPTAVERGRAVYQAECSMCHHPDRHMDGPRHRGVLGRRAGALADYDYSPALRNSRVLWTRATLKAWLANPEAVIPGQQMDMRLENAQDRDDVVAYLATLRDPARTPPR